MATSTTNENGPAVASGAEPATAEPAAGEAPAGSPNAGTAEERSQRRTLVEDTLEEMSRWPAQDRAGAFRRWHQGALSLVHLNVLTVLEVEGPLPMSRLAEALDVSDASATGIVDRLEKRGLLERRHATDDRRVVVVHLTDRGANVFPDMTRHRRERLERLLNELGDREIAGLLDGMRALHAAGRRLTQQEAQSGAACVPNPGIATEPFGTEPVTQKEPTA